MPISTRNKRSRRLGNDPLYANLPGGLLRTAGCSIILLLLKAIAALTSGQAYLFNITLIEGKNLAGLRTAGAISQTAPFIGQHGTGKEKIATGAALPTSPLALGKLLPDIILAAMDDQ